MIYKRKIDNFDPYNVVLAIAINIPHFESKLNLILHYYNMCFLRKVYLSVLRKCFNIHESVSL